MPTVEGFFLRTADDTDLLAGSQFDPTPYDGSLELYGASTQNDTTLQVKIASELMRDTAGTNGGRLPLRTNGMPLISDDPGMIIDVLTGQRAILNLDIVTAATVGIIARLVYEE